MAITLELLNKLEKLLELLIEEKVKERSIKTDYSESFASPKGVNIELARTIDHTLLKANATKAEIKKVCDEAKNYCFASVCVNSTHIEFVAKQLENSQVNPIAVVGFPLGAMCTEAKVYEAQVALEKGAKEIDMVINIGALKDQDENKVLEDIRRVVRACAPYPVKVILETSELKKEEIIKACVLAKAAGAHFVKTSTGFAKNGATVEDVALMRKTVGQEMGVKASGGIRSTEDALAMIQAGANRLGTSASISIVTGKNEKTSGY